MQNTFDGFEDDYERRKERARRREAEMSRKGRDIGPLPKVVDPERKEACRRNFRLYLETYHQEKFYLGWSDDHLGAIDRIERTAFDGGLYAYAMARGSGKTTIIVGAVEWVASYGHRRYIVPIGATGPQAIEMVETIKMDWETNELLFEDFPEICYPARMLEGMNNRTSGQMVNGTRTRIKWSDKLIKLPMVLQEDGTFYPSSGAIIRPVGLLSAMRGKQSGVATGETLRPDFAIPDDPQTDGSARSPAQTYHRLNLLKKGVLNMAGPTTTIAAVLPCTVIVAGDMADQLLDREKYPEWRGTKTRLLRSMPSEAAMKLWHQYREIRKDSLREYEDIRLATEFYRANKDAMDEGCDPSWPERFLEGQISAIQYGMDLWAADELTFFAEFQNEPRHEEEQGIETLRAAELLERCNGMDRGEVPEWATMLTALADVQQDILPWMVVAWGADLRGHIVDYGAWPHQAKRYYTLRDVSPTLRESTGQPTVESAIEVGLNELATWLTARDDWTGHDVGGLKWLGVDANWELSKEIVYQAARRHTILMPFHGRFVGGASLPMAMWKKKPGERQGHFWRTALEKTTRVVHVDINSWKTLALKRLKASVDSGAGITWFGSKPYQHELLCDQLSAEFAVRVSGRGRTVDEWKNRPGRDNHWWDCLFGAMVGASVAGASMPGQAVKPPVRRIKGSSQQRLKRAGVG